MTEVINTITTQQSPIETINVIIKDCDTHYRVKGHDLQEALDFNEEQNIHLTEVQFNIANSIRNKIDTII